MELNGCGTIASFNVHNTVTLKRAGEKRTKSPFNKGNNIEGIRSWMHV